MVERPLPPIEDLEAALFDLAHHIDHPRVGDLAPAVILRLTAVEPPPRRPRWLVVVVSAVLTLVVLLSFPAPRQAVADWLGIGAVRVIRTEQIPDGTGTELRLGREVSLGEARSRAPFTILGPSSLGTPSSIYAGEPSSDSVTLLWGPADRVPAVAATGVGVLLTEMPGSTDRAAIEKHLGPGTSLESTTVGDEAAYWIAGGQHQLQYLDGDGRVRLDTTRLAANTLLWEADGVTYRLESRLDLDASVELASQLRPVP